MAAMTATSGLHPVDDLSQSSSSRISSPASPTTSFQNQQVLSSRSFNINSLRTQKSSFSINSPPPKSNDPPPGMSYHDFIRTWSDSHVARWLTDIKCGNHASTFKANDIRGDVLLELDQVTLKEMGIASIGDRLRIINAVKALRHKSSTKTMPTPPPEQDRQQDIPNPTIEARAMSSLSRDFVHEHRLPHERSASETSLGSRLAARRLEVGRPAPLQLNPSRGHDLPRLVRDGQGPDSARSNASSTNIRPLPVPAQMTNASNTATPTSNASNSTNTSNASSTSVTSVTSNTSNVSNTSGQSNSSTRSNLHLPPAPRIQPPAPPPGRAPPRATGRRTPTQGDVPPYVNQPLPPAPPPSHNQSLLTPVSANSGNWNYGLPSDTRPGNTSGKTTVRATSPLNLQPRNFPRTANANPLHGRHLSASSPNTTSPAKLPVRPGTSGNSHPYATAQGTSLLPIASQQSYNLSPIAESFASQHPPPSGSPSPPSQAYTVGRGPFGRSSPYPNAPSLNDLRWKLVKFVLPEEGHTSTINVADCLGGVEVLEKVLKKVGKFGSRTSDADLLEHVQTNEGGLSVDGWGVYLDPSLGDRSDEALTEAELMSVCNAPPDHSWREHGLILRRIGKKRSKVLAQIFGEQPPTNPGQRSSPTTPDGFSVSPGYSKFTESLLGKNTKRASSVSVLSGLGVQNPERALDPVTPTTPNSKSPTSPAVKKPSKLRNFFGQRPPSELITTHLTEYFPFTEKKVLERTARHSMMLRSGSLSGGRRDSELSFNNQLPSRFSSSTQGSQPRLSTSSITTSISSNPPAVPEKVSPYSPDVPTPMEDIPRMSLSTEDGKQVELNESDDSNHAPTPQLLPPVKFPSQSLTESMSNYTSISDTRRLSRATSNASKRMSYITELRSRRDRSDTASFMTVDQITAEVESRRENGESDRDTDDWTKVDSEEDGGDLEDLGSTLVDDDVPNEVFENDDIDEPEQPASRTGTKWIKGALIGAGSFGKVYLGMDASNGLLMAVKQVELPSGSAPNEERKKSMLSALEREIELLKDLQHENIVQYLYSSLEDDHLNIFLEYVPGGSVTALLRNYGAFEEPLVRNFVRQILEGLNYLHERDIIHRDIKGANILVDNKGGIKISDFGISKKVEDNLLTGNRMHRPSLQGSVFWMAPEVVKQSGHTPKADIWSVGCLVVEMLTGEHPWAQLTQMQAIFKIGSSAKPTIPSDISADAQDFLRCTFELNHHARPNAGELLQHSWVAKKKGHTKPYLVVEQS